MLFFFDNLEIIFNEVELTLRHFFLSISALSTFVYAAAFIIKSGFFFFNKKF